MNTWLGWKLCSFWFAAHIYVVHKNCPFSSSEWLLTSSQQTVSTSSLGDYHAPPITYKKKLWMLSSQWHANIANMNCFLLSRGCNGSSDDSYGIYAWIHWRNMKCNASPQPHRRKVKTRAIFCLSRVRNKSRMTTVDAIATFKLNRTRNMLEVPISSKETSK